MWAVSRIHNEENILWPPTRLHIYISYHFAYYLSLLEHVTEESSRALTDEVMTVVVNIYPSWRPDNVGSSELIFTKYNLRLDHLSSDFLHLWGNIAGYGDSISPSNLLLCPVIGNLRPFSWQGKR